MAEERKKISGRPAPHSFTPWQAALAKGREEGPVDDSGVRAEMSRNRRIASKLAQAMNGRGGGGGGPSVSFATGRPRDPLFYWRQNNLPFDYTKDDELPKIREYCNTPDAPILMADGTFKPIGEVVVGDEVIGWDWKVGPQRRRKRMVSTKVLATKRREAPMVVEATMESGRVIRCTPDHQWANYWHASAPGANEYEPLIRPSKGGPGGPTRFNTMVSLVQPVAPLVNRKDVEAAGYLAGIIDADGTVSGGEIRIGQSAEVNGAICERIEAALNVLGLDYRVNDRTPGVRLWILRGTLENRARLRTWMPWSVKVEQAWNDRLGWAGSKDHVVEVRAIGPGEVVSMQTETGNYIAWGYGSRNCRLLYMTHPIIASAIDIFSKYPLTGMEFVCKDKALTDFYTDLFFDELGYEDYLIDVGREYWTVGEAWPLGSFNEMLGIWESDELLNPDDVEVKRSPFLKEPRFEIRLPETLRKIIQERSPKWEFEQLMATYPELKNFLGDQARMPVSNVLLKQLRFKADTFFPRGVPILMRAFRAVMQEEMMMAAMDSVADRLYTPLIVAKLGASASDLGTSQPWVPTEDDLADFEEALDAALAGDFRVLVHHFALEIGPVLGREVIPNMDNDFDRLEERILQTFGLSRTMLSGAGSGETYAADALNRDLISQLLTTYQRLIKKFVKDRMLVVAEAQEHYDYEERGGKRYPVMEEVLEIDEETGEQRIVEQPKLLVPDLKIKVMSMQDEESTRQFYEALRASGVPISMQTRLVNVPIDLDDEVERTHEEQVNQAVEAEEVRKETYKELKARGLHIPDDLLADYEPKAMQAKEQAGQDQEQPIPTVGMTAPTTMALAPTPEEMAAAAQGAEAGGGEMPPQAMPPMGAVIPLPRNQMLQHPARPPESDEMRAGMPKPAKIIVTAEDGSEEEIEVTEGRSRLISGPRHVGMRRHAGVRRDVPLDEEAG